VKSSSKRGLQHDKNSEQVRGNASTQPCGLCCNKKSEQAGGNASTSIAPNFEQCIKQNISSQLIVEYIYLMDSEGAKQKYIIVSRTSKISLTF
jgi:hypothetical protein